jgi:hypothetical protein
MSEALYEAVTQWGRSASPFSVASNVVQLNWVGVNYWIKVSKAAKAGRELLKEIDGLEKGARALKNAADELAYVEGQIAVPTAAV